MPDLESGMNSGIQGSIQLPFTSFIVSAVGFLWLLFGSHEPPWLGLEPHPES